MSEAVRTRRWTRVEYDRPVEHGMFAAGERIELPGGLLVVREPQGGRHAMAPSTRSRSPSPMSAWYAHPADAVLVVEVADSSLALDRGEKAGLYARARVPEYWIVNLMGHALEVYRDSAPDARAPFGWRYREVVTFRAGETITPIAAPAAVIAVADLVP